MSTINELASTTPADSQLVPVFDTPNGMARQFSLSALVDWLQGKLTTDSAFEKQVYAPNATGWTVLISPTVDGSNVWLLLTPNATHAAGTVRLPPQSDCVDQQEVVVNCTQIVTALTVDGNGAVVNGAPTTLAAANGFFRLRFEGVAKAWYRVG